MTKEEVIKRLTNLAEHAVHFSGEPTFVMSLDDGIALNLALEMLADEKIEIPIYDIEEIHHGCTVQVLTSSVTGESSVGWWKEEE